MNLLMLWIFGCKMKKMLPNSYMGIRPVTEVLKTCWISLELCTIIPLFLIKVLILNWKCNWGYQRLLPDSDCSCIAIRGSLSIWFWGRNCDNELRWVTESKHNPHYKGWLTPTWYTYQSYECPNDSWLQRDHQHPNTKSQPPAPQHPNTITPKQLLGA